MLELRKEGYRILYKYFANFSVILKKYVNGLDNERLNYPNKKNIGYCDGY